MAGSTEAPAYRIALVSEQLATLGEIVVIIGQIDDDLARSLTGILKIDRPTANKLMWTQDAIDLWAGVMKGRIDHPHFEHALELARSEVRAVLRDRNDFVHADYRNTFPLNGSLVTVRGSANFETLATPIPAVASRNRDQRRRDASELKGLRNRAARASRLVAHIAYSVAPHGGWEESPWLPSIEPFLARSSKRAIRTDLPGPKHLQIIDGIRPMPIDEAGDEENGAAG
jgi:hypothetical protein